MHDIIHILTDMKKCTGCEACLNICPKNAISMQEGYRTFRYPVIDNNICIRCGMCVKVCPIISLSNNNTATPDIYAIKASDDIRKHSSSGGFFTVAASHIINNNGVVYGAALSENIKVQHVRAETLQDVLKCCGSKYVQSEIGDIYRRIKSDLLSDRLVFFTGCPCQVAGLKNYLGQDYNKLITADIVCHGVPSQKCFDLYLTEKSEGASVDTVRFRDKKFGWRADVTEILLKNGSELINSLSGGDEWQIAFQQCYILRDSCEHCKFCTYPRVGDITFGDFWGIEQFRPNDGKGTSLIFINNKKGNEFFNKLFSTFSMVEKLEIPYSSLKNRLFEYYPHSDHKKLFFDLLNRHGFCESVKMASSGKYDVALIGIPTVENFGGALTYLALFSFLKKMGYACVIIERPLNSPHPPTSLSNIYYKSPYDNGDIIINIKTRRDLTAYNNISDKYLVGSDQLYSPVLMHNFQSYALLDWVPDNKLKVAYAASFGPDNIQFIRQDIPTLSYYLKKFDSFSVREESAVKIAKEKYGLDAKHVLDPVFLCDKSIFTELASNAKINFDGNYIAGYILDPDSNKASHLVTIQDKMRVPLKIFSEMFYNNDTIRNKWSIPIEIGKIEDRLLCIKNSRLVITDSFHGMCISLLFEKDFVVILNKNRGANRFISILKELDLESRIVDPKDDIYEAYISMPSIDYDKINSKLSVMTECSKNWLIQSLENNKAKSYSDYDILVQMLQRENDKLLQHIDMMEKCLGINYCFQTDLSYYIDTLISEANHILICIAAKDTPGMSISQQLMDKLHILGIKTELMDKHWCGFISAIYNGINISEKCVYDKTVTDTLKIGDLDVKLLSAPLHDGNRSEIIINGKNYSVNSRGLNFVVYDLRYGRVVDKCGFDTHSHMLTCTRL